jgi:hypothetical protein
MFHTVIDTIQARNFYCTALTAAVPAVWQLQRGRRLGQLRAVRHVRARVDRPLRGVVAVQPEVGLRPPTNLWQDSEKILRKNVYLGEKFLKESFNQGCQIFLGT